MAPARREGLILGAIGLAAGALGGVAGVLGLQSGSGAAELLSAKFVDLQGAPRRLLDWQGRALLCNFWATWCPPCLEEVPLFAAAKQHWLPDSWEIVGIAIDSAANIADFAAKHQIHYPLLVGDATTIGLVRSLGNPSGGLPFTVLLDQRGVLRGRWLGALKEADLRQILARSLR